MDIFEDLPSITHSLRDGRICVSSKQTTNQEKERYGIQKTEEQTPKENTRNSLLNSKGKSWDKAIGR